MSVVDGQNANASTFNSAFASKSSDNTLTGKQTLSRPGSGATVIDEQQAINDLIASDALKIPTAEKGVANGVATLDASTLIPVAQVPNLTASKITDFNTAADARITAQKGAASGIAPLDGSSKIDASYLPSYVDDVVEVANFAALPVTGETGKIYVTLDTNKTYRWSGSVYVNIGQPIASTDNVPEGSINQYFTPARVADKQIGIQFQDQGSNLGTTATVDTIDFIGAGITATRSTNKVTVEVTATGGGGGSKNYFSQSSINPDFETGTVSPWQAMTTTWSGSAPVNAPTAGAVVTSFYTNIVNPLAGTTSATMTKGLGNGQYEGVMSGVFSVDREDLAKVLYGSFAYEVAGTVASDFDVSGTSTQSLEIWLYNVNANQWIQPAGFRGINQFTGSGKVTFSFQTDATVANNQYRICLIVRQNTTGAWNLKVDDFSVGPQAIVLGTPVTDWQSYTPTFTGFGTATNVEFQYRRVGSDLEIRGKFTSGTPTATEARITFPSGLTSSDISKIPSIQLAGYGARNVINAAYNYNMLIEPSTSYLTIGAESDILAGLTKQNGSTLFGSGQAFSFFAKIPIQGWASFSQVSSDTDTRVVSARYSLSSGSPVAGSQINFANIGYDTHGAVTTGASWKYTAPVSGYYRVSLALCTGASNNIFALFKNGTLDSNMSYTIGASATNNVSSSSTVLSLKAGDYFDIRPSTSNGSYAAGGGTGSSISTSNYITVERLSGPSVITATETFAASYYLSANFSASTTIPINYDVKEFDSHNAVTTSPTAWKFTAPVSGTYSIGYFIYSGNTVTDLKIYKNGSSYKNIGFLQTVTGGLSESGNALIRLNAGDYIDFRPSGAVTITGGVQTSNNCSQIYISRIGN